MAGTRVLETDLPARIDRLPWSRWHWLVVVALGITWILDGLEVTIVGALGSVLEDPHALALTGTQVGLAGTTYLAGAIAGSLTFGYLTDRHGRKKLFLVTLGLYLAATTATALSWSFASFAVFRFFTGTAIGGEYAAINSAIDELIPARVRGTADLAINGSYWIGTAFGASLTTVLLDPTIFPVWLGWRVAFGLGVVLAGSVVLVRRFVPESPRWLLLQGRHAEAEEIVSTVERHARERHGELPPARGVLRIRVDAHLSFARLARVLWHEYRSRTALGLSLMIAQAFFYNAIFFSYSLMLTRFFGVAPDRVGLFLLPFAAGNFLGPLVLGRLFDSFGRRPMMIVTYAASGILLLATGEMFVKGWLDATTQTICWSVVFFFASAAASSAYLTVSELFPLELRGMAIAFFYAVGTGVGGLAAPALFGALVQTGERVEVFHGYVLGSALMIAAAFVVAVLGVAAERRSLEEIALPLSAEAEAEAGREG